MPAEGTPLDARVFRPSAIEDGGAAGEASERSYGRRDQ